MLIISYLWNLIWICEGRRHFLACTLLNLTSQISREWFEANVDPFDICTWHILASWRRHFADGYMLTVVCDDQSDGKRVAAFAWCSVCPQGAQYVLSMYQTRPMSVSIMSPFLCSGSLCKAIIHNEIYEFAGDGLSDNYNPTQSCKFLPIRSIR